MNKKYQVFISSTYEDLKEERDQVIMAILQMDHIPIGMEMFNAADEEQWKTITRQIDDADYYIVIIAHRYGSITNEGVSYTEKEYDYARVKGVPVLAFVIHEDAPWPAALQESDFKQIRSLRAFKNKVRNRQVQFWKNKDDLPGKVSTALGQAIRRSRRVGWIQTSQARAYLEAQDDNPTVCIDITNMALINGILRDIGAINDFGAYVELRGPQIRDFQDVGVTTISRNLHSSGTSGNSLEILAFDITKDPQIWLNRRNHYIAHNADFIASGGRIARLFFIDKEDCLNDDYCRKLYDLFTICVDSKMDIGVAFSDDDYVEDFVLFPGLGVLKEINQPPISNRGGSSIAFFDDNSIFRFKGKFTRKFDDRARARAERFRTNFANGKCASDNLDDISRWDL